MRLSNYLHQERQAGRISSAMQQLITHIAQACTRISAAIAQGGIGNHLGVAGTHNSQGEVQKKLDILSHAIFLEDCFSSGQLAGIVSEETETICYPAADDRSGPLLLAVDPLDGSSNIDNNITIGSIFSILPAVPERKKPEVLDFLQLGKNQLCAGYCMYGPSTLLVLSFGYGVDCFTLRREDCTFALSYPQMRIPLKTQEFALNMSNQRYWDDGLQKYIFDVLQGELGPRKKNFNMRWTASMVAEVHRILMRGGLFSYPKDARHKDLGGHLRLLYEANPMAYLVEQAGGAASNGHSRILDMQPTAIHQRVPVFLGSQEEVAKVAEYLSRSE